MELGESSTTNSKGKALKRKGSVKKSPKAKQSSSSRKLPVEEFYVLLKRSYSSNVCTVLTDEDKSGKTNIEDNIKLIKALLTENSDFSRKQMYNHCQIGLAFKNIKAEMKAKKITDKNLDELLLQNLGEKHGFSKSNRNFYIQLHDFVLIYNKIMYTSMPFGDLKHHFPKLQPLIENDPEFCWKSIV